MTVSLAPGVLEDCVAFARRLIQTPSMPGEEAAIAALVATELERLGFEAVGIDAAGNVNGRMAGRDRSLPALVLNSHLDHVDPGDPRLWARQPYAAVVEDGRIYGRGACDIKGPLAVQVYAIVALRRLGERPRRDVVFSGVVQEETGGAGARYWVDHLDYPVGLVVLGEPSANQLSLGHRGITQLWVTFPGRSVHASVPEKGDNPNYALATFIDRLLERQGELSSHPLLGPTTVAPTLIEVDTRSMNVTPAWTRLLLDIRTASESPRSLQRFIDGLAAGLPHALTDAQAAEPGTPPADTDEIIVGFYTAADSQVVAAVRQALAAGMGRAPELTRYRFATDGRHFAPLGVPIVGYSPGEEELAHTVLESISIVLMAESLAGHAALLRTF
jgi:succinyl-diaminopimelate desuccinylase